MLSRFLAPPSRLVAAALLVTGSPAAAAPSAGQPAPAFALKGLDGKAHSLASLRGRLVVLHFWATWCPACRKEMPVLEEATRAHRDDMIVLGINLAEKQTSVAAYAKAQGLTFPILLDPRGKVAAAYEVLGLPVTLLVDGEGRVAESVAMGSLTREALEALIARHRTGDRPSP